MTVHMSDDALPVSAEKHQGLPKPLTGFIHWAYVPSQRCSRTLRRAGLIWRVG